MGKTIFSVSIGRHCLCISLAVCFALLGIAPLAAEQVGTAIVDGRIVILDSDRTWRFKDEAEGASENGCDKVKGVDICLKDLGWRPLKMQTVGAFAALYTNESKFYFGIIVEPFGKKDGLTTEALQSAIITNAANSTGVSAAQIPVLATETEVKEVAGARSITYNPTKSGTPLIFHNVFKITNDKSIQMVFWSIGKQMTPEFQTIIKKSLAKIKLN